MLQRLSILADDTDAWIKFAVIGIGGAFWLIGQFVAAANKAAKKSGNRPPPFVPPQRLQGTPRPPSLSTIGRPGGPATTIPDPRRLAAAQAAQARAAQARLAATLRTAPMMQQRKAPAIPQRAAPGGISTPLAQSAPSAPRPGNTQRAAVAAVQRADAPITASASRPAIRPILTPQSLRTQFILTEIISPPIALRQSENRLI